MFQPTCSRLVTQLATGCVTWRAIQSAIQSANQGTNAPSRRLSVSLVGLALPLSFMAAPAAGHPSSGYPPVAVWPTAQTVTHTQVGRLAGIRVLDRITGAALPIYEHQGEFWIVGIPGNRYAISMQKQAGPGRALLVTSVDGINVISGQTAAYNQTGYVVSGFGSYEVTGWRKSLQEVAAFTFAAPTDSYAAKTGRAANIGVIGLAMFSEKVARPSPAELGQQESERRESMRENTMRENTTRENTTRESSQDKARGESRGAEAPARLSDRGDSSSSAASAGAAKSASPGAQESAAARAMAPAPVSPGLGTQHGQREASPTRNVAFTRASDSPEEVVLIRYDTQDNLVRRGILAYAQAPVGSLPPPAAFPRSAGFVPDPPRHN